MSSLDVSGIIAELLSLVRRLPYTRFALLPTLLLCVAVLWIATRRPELGATWFHRAGRAFAHLARRRRLSVLLVGLVSFLIGALLSLLVRMPVPGIHDEFSYLLAADTFVEGRLSNPPHPLWVHFETFHVLLQPAYASKYPPGQGLFLALGQLLLGLPIAGVWLGVALGCAAICWMLQAGMPPRFALAGGLIAALHPLCIQWSQSYWGGGVAMLGGALLLGGLARLVRKPRLTDAFWMALGMVILANSRPYEGAVLTLAACVPLFWRLVRRDAAGARLRRVVLPGVLTLALAAGAMAVYNRSITGSPFRMPYMLYQAQYDPVPVFLFQRPRANPDYRRVAFQQGFNAENLNSYNHQRASIPNLLAAFNGKGRTVMEPFSRFSILALSLTALLCALLHHRVNGNARLRRKDRGVGWGLVTLFVFIAAVLPETYSFSHYAAPAVGLMFLLALQGLRYLRVWRWRGKALGRWTVRTLPLVCAASLLHTIAFCADPPLPGGVEKRARIERSLAARPGERNLILVRYAPTHSPHVEWVYNRADIDNAPVVWAREMDPAQNRKLLRYFRDRRAWLLEADAKDPILVPYSAPQSRRLSVKDANQ